MSLAAPRKGERALQDSLIGQEKFGAHLTDSTWDFPLVPKIDRADVTNFELGDT
jgi:hypothetical protein